MKKGLAILAIAGLLAGAYFGYKFLSKPRSVESMLPEDTVAYLQLDDLALFQSKWKHTSLGRQMEKSPRREMYTRQWERGLTLLESTSGIDLRLLGSQIEKTLAVAVIPSSQTGIAAFAGLKDEKKTREVIEQNYEPALKRRVPDLEKKSQNHNGQYYSVYSSSQFKSEIQPCYFISDHWLIFASTEETMRAILDAKAGKKKSLEKSGRFRDAEKKVQYEDGIFLFANAKESMSLLRSRFHKDHDKLWDGIFKISGVENLDYLAYRFSIQNQGFEEMGFFAVRPESQGLLKVYLEQKPRAIRSIHSVPQDFEGVTITTLPDLAKMWDEANVQLKSVFTAEQYEKWEKLDSTLKSLFDFDLKRDLFDPVGDEFVFAYSSAGNPDWKSKEYLIALHLRSEQQFRATFDRLISLGSLQGLVRREESYKGINLQVFEMSSGNLPLTPACYFGDGWFYLASHDGVLKRSIDAIQQKKGIQEIPDFQKVTAGFPDKLNSLAYTNVRSYLSMYSELLNRESSDPEKRWMREYKLNEELKYLSDGLYGSASCSQFQKDGITWVTHSSIPSAFLAFPAALSSLPEILLKR